MDLVRVAKVRKLLVHDVVRGLGAVLQVLLHRAFVGTAWYCRQGAGCVLRGTAGMVLGVQCMVHGV